MALTAPAKPIEVATAMHCRPTPFLILVALGCAGGCREPGPTPAPTGAEPQAAAVAEVPLAPANAPLATAPGAEEEEAPPSGPAVDVRVADDPAQPLAW